jgi:glycosyltransferase involved in cell wall biosynthesis
MTSERVSIPRVSVVIPTYNRSELVVQAIESVLAQTYTDFEIIVADDGSTDDTAARIQPYLDRIIYAKQRNRGVAAARNTGIRLAKGEFVCFLDSDDLWEPAKLETQVCFADSHPEYALISTEIQGFNSEQGIRGQSKSSSYQIRNGHVVEHLLYGNWIQTSTVMVCRACLEEVGWFDEDVGQFGEDWLLWMRVASRYPVYFLPEPLVSYRFHPGQLTLYQTQEQFRSLMRCIEKLSALPYFRQKPQLLREAEYRICMGRAWRDRSTGEYEQATAKLKRAAHLRRFPIAPFLQLVRTYAERQMKRRTPHAG